MGCGAATRTQVNDFSPVTIKGSEATLLELKHLQPDRRVQSHERSAAPPGAKLEAERPLVDDRSDTSSLSIEVVQTNHQATPTSSVPSIADASAGRDVPTYIASWKSPTDKLDKEAIVERLATLAFTLAEKKPLVASGLMMAAAGIVSRLSVILGAGPQPAIAVALASAALSAAEASSATAPGLIKTAASVSLSVSRSRSHRMFETSDGDDIGRESVDLVSFVAGHRGNLLLVEGLAESATELASVDGRFAADLARAAAGFAKCAIPETLEFQLEPHPDVACGLAKVACAAAQVGSPTAVFMIQAAATSAVNAIKPYCEIAEGKIMQID